MTEIMALIETDSGALSQPGLELLAIGQRLSESSELIDRLEAQRLQFNQYLNNCDR